MQENIKENTKVSYKSNFILIDSRKIEEETNKYTFKLQQEFTNVHSLKLHHGQVPPVNYLFPSINIVLNEKPVNFLANNFSFKKNIDIISSILNIKMFINSENKVEIKNEEDITLEGELKILGFDDNKLEGKEFKAQHVITLYSDPYILLNLTNIKCKQSPMGDDKCFAQIFYPTESTAEKYNCNIVPEHIFDPPLEVLEEFNIEFRNWNDELTNFQNHHHLLIFEVKIKN